MLKNKLLEELRDEISPEDKILMEESFALADRIYYLLKKHNVSQRQLAEKLGKSESEVSKWLSGGHNFTANTLTKIGIAIGERIYTIPGKSPLDEHIENILKSCIVRVVSHEAVKHDFIYESFISSKLLEKLSEPGITSAGIMLNRKYHHLYNINFSPANLKAESFRNIEQIMVN
jgi:transcriptional regulator with XRE-family HTH domain